MFILVYTGDSISDVTEKSSVIDNDETCSEASSVTNDVNSAVNASSPTAQKSMPSCM